MIDGPSGATGRVALITGASGGIGAAVARSLRADGLMIAAHHYLDAEAARALCDELGPDSVVVESDLREREQVRRMVAAVDSAFGRLDVVVNCAGIMEQAAFTDLSDDLWCDVVATNLTGPYRVVSEALRLLQDGDRPSVVNVSSQLAYSGAAGAVAYTASKAGLLGFTRALARELGPRIRVNAIAPGPVETPMTAAHATPEWVAEKTARLVMGRFAQPEEISGAVRFLVSDEASFITGQTISVNGGGVMP